MRRRERRRAYAELGGGGGFLVVEYWREKREGEGREWRQLEQM